MSAHRWGEIADNALYEVGQRDDRTARFEDARLDPTHVEQALYELSKAICLDIDQLGQALAGFGRDVDLGVGQRRRRCLDRGKWSSKVVGDRGDESLREPLDLLGQPCP